MVVHQVLSGAGPFDAVTRQALAIRERFRAWGWGGSDWAPFIDPREGLGRRVRDLRGFSAEASDTVLLHFSAYAPRMAAVLDGPWRSLLLSHNVTPARWFWDHEPQVALQCELGRRQLPELAARCDAVAGVSAFNAAELGTDRVVPLLLDLRADAAFAEPAGPPTVLFVGRLAPHKRQDEVIRAFALLRRHRDPDARLGSSASRCTRLRRRAARAGRRARPGAVTFERSLSDDALAARYRGARRVPVPQRARGVLHPAARGVRPWRAGRRASPGSRGRDGRRRGARPRRPARRDGRAGAPGDDRRRAARHAARARPRAAGGAYAPERAEAALRAFVEAA